MPEKKIELNTKETQPVFTNEINPMIANFQGFSSIETHTNIVVNKAFSREDFIPSFPWYQKSN
jgi:hypothetical protein